MEVTGKIADFVANTNLSQIPSEGQEIGKRAILDCLGVALAGSLDPMSGKIVDFLQDLGGNPQATVWGRRLKTSSPMAALANGLFGHALDFDDWNRSMRGHPTVPVIPSALAVGEEMRSSGKEILEAYLLGFEVECKLGLALNPHLFAAGWHPTAVLGVMGSAAAAAKILKLEPKKIQMALGIAASQAGGLRQNFGTMTKPLHVGQAAKNGLMAAKLAQRDFTADPSAIEEKLGYANAFAGEGKYDFTGLSEGLGRPFSILSPGVGLKRFPSCARTHPAIDAMLELATQNDIRPEEVESITCGGSYTTPQVLIHSRPQSALEGKFSMEFCMALALLERRVELSQFTDQKIRDPRIQDFISRVILYVRDDLKTIESSGNPSVTVTVVMKDGRRMTKRVDEAKGGPRDPLSVEEVRNKYRQCARLVQSEKEMEKTMEIVENLESLPDISTLTGLLGGFRRGKG